MRIHSDVLTDTQVRHAVLAAGLKDADMRLVASGSRSRKRRFDLRLIATWDEWGLVLAYLFRIDPNMGLFRYRNKAHFEWVTAGRYEDLRPYEQHKHKWEHDGQASTATYSVHRCKCRATLRAVMPGHDWSEIESA